MKIDFNPTNFTSIYFMILLFILENYKTIHDFSVWLRTGSNSADINRFPSHTRLRDLPLILFQR